MGKGLWGGGAGESVCVKSLEKDFVSRLGVVTPDKPEPVDKVDAMEVRLDSLRVLFGVEGGAGVRCRSDGLAGDVTVILMVSFENVATPGVRARNPVLLLEPMVGGGESNPVVLTVRGVLVTIVFPPASLLRRLLLWEQRSGNGDDVVLLVGDNGSKDDLEIDFFRALPVPDDECEVGDKKPFEIACGEASSVGFADLEDEGESQIALLAWICFPKSRWVAVEDNPMRGAGRCFGLLVVRTVDFALLPGRKGGFAA
jgi:hypothetical protein